MPQLPLQEISLQLPTISLGLWHNFSFVDDFQNGRTLFLLLSIAWDYPRWPTTTATTGSSEENFLEKILKENLLVATCGMNSLYLLKPVI
jgi:hypothetical protein